MNKLIMILTFSLMVGCTSSPPLPPEPTGDKTLIWTNTETETVVEVMK